MYAPLLSIVFLQFSQFMHRLQPDIRKMTKREPREPKRDAHKIKFNFYAHKIEFKFLFAHKIEFKFVSLSHFHFSFSLSHTIFRRMIFAIFFLENIDRLMEIDICNL